MLDFGRFNGAPASQGRPGGFQQSFMEEGYGATSSTGIMPGDEAGFTAGYPSSKPPTFPPPSPPAAQGLPAASDFGFQNDDFPALGAMGRQVSGSPTNASAAGRGNGQILAGSDLSRVLLGPPPPPPQAPLVPSNQLQPALQGPPMGLAQLRPSSSGKTEEERLKEELRYHSTPEAERSAREKYGLLGILKVIRMTDPDLNTLALGMDLTNLGLNLNSPECLYATFASPWSDAPARKDPEFYLPPCYYMNPPTLKTAHLQKFSWETLFYIFFNMPRDALQAYAAAELYNRGWKYHRELKTWFILQEEDVGLPRWVCFDPTAWEKHYYHHTVDVTGFLAEEEVRVKIMPSGALASPA